MGFSRGLMYYGVILLLWFFYEWVVSSIKYLLPSCPQLLLVNNAYRTSEYIGDDLCHISNLNHVTITFWGRLIRIVTDIKFMFLNCVHVMTLNWFILNLMAVGPAADHTTQPDA